MREPDHRKVDWLITALIIITVIMGAITVATIFLHRDDLSEKIQTDISERVSAEVKALNLKNGKTPQLGVDYHDGVNGYTPVKGIDYRDGKDGKKGDKGESAYELTVKSGFVGTEEDWLNSLHSEVILPEFKCNSILNRWEVKYPSDTSWQILNGEIVACLGLL